MTEASPVKWHLAHTSWFFETFILCAHQPGFSWYDERFRYLFNSYYNAVGRQYPRARRGLISQPSLDRVHDYRDSIDERMSALLSACGETSFQDLAPLLVLGLNHEQQHQELIATDIRHALLSEAEMGAGDAAPAVAGSAQDTRWIQFGECRTVIGHRGGGFCFDNELAAHEVLLPDFELASHPVSNAEWAAFIEDGGYRHPLIWLSDGWAWKEENSIEAPLYWRKTPAGWARATLRGVRAIEPAEPVRHVSYYEADAYSAWAGARLPRETEWEHAARECGWRTNGAGADCGESELARLGRNWEWTQSAYLAYPGFRALSGMAGEYNGKFMVNQMVLRGASSATPPLQSRASYRNFFHPGARWQYTGLRLARDPQ